MTELLEVRVAENSMYRLVEESDLVAGAKIFMVDVLDSYQVDHPYWIIRLDDKPVRETEGGPYVYYHCIIPKWDGQCFVPQKEFLGHKDRPDVGPYDIYFWLRR